LRGGTNNPVTPSSTNSGIPPVRVATTGTLAVVEVATGEVLVLTLPNIGRHLSSPVWKP